MKEFIKNLFSDGAVVSSKRFAGILSLLVGLSLAYIDTFGNKVSSAIFDAILFYSAGALGLSVIDKFSKKTEAVKTDDKKESETKVD